MFLVWAATYALAHHYVDVGRHIRDRSRDGNVPEHVDCRWQTQAQASHANSGADDGVDQGEYRMDEAAHTIEAHIEQTRERLGSNLKELETEGR